VSDMRSSLLLDAASLSPATAGLVRRPGLLHLVLPVDGTPRAGDMPIVRADCWRRSDHTPRSAEGARRGRVSAPSRSHPGRRTNRHQAKEVPDRGLTARWREGRADGKPSMRAGCARRGPIGLAGWQLRRGTTRRHRGRPGHPHRPERPAGQRRPPGPGTSQPGRGLHRRRPQPAARRTRPRPGPPRPRGRPGNQPRLPAVGVAAGRPRRPRPE